MRNSKTLCASWFVAGILFGINLAEWGLLAIPLMFIGYVISVGAYEIGQRLSRRVPQSLISWIANQINYYLLGGGK